MIKSKLPFNILELVSKAYAGRKATLKLEALSYYREMTDAQKEEFRLASRNVASIKKEYKFCIDADQLTDEEIQKEQECA